MVSKLEKSRLFVIERTLSCIFALSVIFIFEPKGVALFFIVTSLPHFFLTYVYQGLAGKIKLWYLIPYTAALLLSFFWAFNDPKTFVLFVAVFFLFHHFYDEFKLLGRNPHVLYLPLILAIIAVMSSWLVEEFWRLGIAPYIAVAGAVVGVVMALAWALLRKQLSMNIKPYAVFLFGLLGGVVTIEFAGLRPDYLEAIGFVILMHGMAWYINLGHRFYHEGGGKLKSYLWRVLWMNFLFLSGFAYVYYVGFSGPVYDYVYEPLAFYVWTLMHLLTTIRFSDFGNTLKMPEFALPDKGLKN